MKELKFNFPVLPILELTGTATNEMKIKLVEHLSLEENFVIFQSSFNRENLVYKVVWKPDDGDLYDTLLYFQLLRFENQSGIIYCKSKARCEELY